MDRKLMPKPLQALFDQKDKVMKELGEANDKVTAKRTELDELDNKINQEIKNLKGPEEEPAPEKKK